MILSLADIERKYLRFLELTNRSPATVANYRRLFLNLHQFARDTDVAITTDTLNTDLVRDYQHWLIITPLRRAYRGSTKRTPGGIFLQMELIKRLTGWLTEEGLLPHPVKVTLPKVPQRRRTALSSEQLEHLLQSPYLDRHHPQGLRNLALFSIMLDCGLRLAETASLSDDCFYFQSGLVRVIGKGDKERFVPFSTVTEDILKDWMRDRDVDPVWPPSLEAQQNVFRLSRGGIRELFRKIRVETGIRELTPHVMRHTAATAMIANGMEAFALQRILGHADIKTTQIYVHQDDRDVKAKHNSASPVVNLEQRRQPAGPVRQAKISRARAQRITRPTNIVPLPSLKAS